MTTESTPITIAVAEDHNLVRQGIVLLLKSDPGFKLVGECADGFAALELVKAQRPDVLLVDLMLPRVHGLEVIRQLRNDFPQTRAIVLSMHKEESFVAEALRNGAYGYVLKDATATDLAEAVRKVKAGRRYLSPALEEAAISLFEHKPLDTEHDVSESLTSRERLVLQFAAEGASSTTIADRLHISPRTAETHRANLMRKLGLKSQTDLVRFAIRKGIIPA